MASLVRSAHARRVVRLVHLEGLDSRAAIAAATGMSTSLVSRVTAELLRRGVLVARSDGGARPGRPTERLSLDPSAGYVVGVEVARDVARFVRTDARGEVVARWRRDGGMDEPSADAIRGLAEDVAAASTSNEGPPLLAVGAALPEVVTARGAWRRTDGRGADVPAAELLADALDVPVVVDDVSRAFADAEHRFGAGRDAPDMIYVFLGREGVGGGVFAGDAPLRSSSGICGEIGHVVVEPDGARCTCGNRGCLETVATHEALLRRARGYLEQGVRSTLAPDAGVHELLAAARAGDKVGTLILHDLARHLRDAVTPAVALTGATTVVLGGDVRASGPSLPALLTEQLKRTALPPLAVHVHVRWAELDRDAGARGVAVAALDAAVASGAWLHRDTEGAIAM
jgi:predicted NBD/HSP70 family sugar kinase